eukprot:186688-Pyramimonas_sp.AAC.1
MLIWALRAAECKKLRNRARTKTALIDANLSVRRPATQATAESRANRNFERCAGAVRNSP